MTHTNLNRKADILTEQLPGTDYRALVSGTENEVKECVIYMVKECGKCIGVHCDMRT